MASKPNDIEQAIAKDLELAAMRDMAKAWLTVPEEARGRVLDWFAAFALGKPAVWISTEAPRNEY